MSAATEIRRLQQAKLDIKAAIEEKGITVGDGTIDTYAEKISEISGGGSGDYDQGYEDGKNSVVQVERYAKILQLPSLNVFGKNEVVLNLENITSLQNFVYLTANDTEHRNTTVERLTINTPSMPTSMQQVLYCHSTVYDNKLKHLTLNFSTKDCTTFANALTNMRALEIIDGEPLDFSSAISVSNILNYCAALVEVRFVPNTLSKSIKADSLNYSTETIQSIFDGLATVDTAQTLTLHANLKILQSQVDSANAKGWTVAGGTIVSEEEYYG